MIELSRLVEPPAELAATYIDQGWWGPQTLQSVLATGLEASRGRRFSVRSASRPYEGTIADVQSVATGLAAGLQRAGIRAGDVVAFQLPNWMEAAASFWGLASLGVTLLPIPHFYGPHELRHILGEAQARAVVITHSFGRREYLDEMEAIRDDLPELELIVVVGETPLPRWATPFTSVIAEDGGFTSAEVEPSAPAVIGYTSGTNDKPKGVILSHRSLAFETTQHIGKSYSSPRPLLSGSPVTHAAGMLVSLLVPPLQGAPIHLIDVWDPTQVLVGMREDDLTAGWGAAIFLTSLLDHPDLGPDDLARMGCAYLGGSPVPSSLVERAESMGIWVGRSYGCTEQPTISFTHPDDPYDKRVATNGRPMLGVDVKVVDPGGEQVPTGMAGELWTRGPDRCSGYMDPALSAEAFDADGWFRTGDIGSLDADGYLTISDRLKDIIIRGGENISAAEVEGFISQMPGVAEVAVVAAPDPRYGERACAFVRARPGGDAPDLATVQRHLHAAGLSRLKWPEDLRTVDELPRTPSGKVKKSALRDALRADAAVSAAADAMKEPR